MSDPAIHVPDTAPGATDPPERGRMMRSLHAIWLILTLRCERADLIRIRASHGETDWTERMAERLHRFICHTCRRSQRQSEAVDLGLRSFGQREIRHRV
jgi:hypothetical protein